MKMISLSRDTNIYYSVMTQMAHELGKTNTIYPLSQETLRLTHDCLVFFIFLSIDTSSGLNLTILQADFGPQFPLKEALIYMNPLVLKETLDAVRGEALLQRPLWVTANSNSSDIALHSCQVDK